MDQGVSMLSSVGLYDDYPNYESCSEGFTGSQEPMRSLDKHEIFPYGRFLAEIRQIYNERSVRSQ